MSTMSFAFKVVMVRGHHELMQRINSVCRRHAILCLPFYGGTCRYVYCVERIYQMVSREVVGVGQSINYIQAYSPRAFSNPIALYLQLERT